MRHLSSQYLDFYDEHTVTVDGFKENNIELMKGCWIDTRHGKEGGKIYELFDENMDRETDKGRYAGVDV